MFCVVCLFVFFVHNLDKFGQLWTIWTDLDHLEHLDKFYIFIYMDDLNGRSHILVVVVLAIDSPSAPYWLPLPIGSRFFPKCFFTALSCMRVLLKILEI